MTTHMLPTLLTFAPLLGVLLLPFFSRESKAIRLTGILATLPSLVLSIVMYVLYHAHGAAQFAQSMKWFSVVGVRGEWLFQYSMGADGLSIPLVVLTCVVATLAAIASTMIKDRAREYYMLMLLLLVGMNGVFLATNFFLFFLFFELTLIAMFFLIGVWGFLNKEKAANYFLLYNGLGSVFMLFAMLGLLYIFGTLDYASLQKGLAYVATLPIAASYSLLLWLIFISLLVAFAIKLPVFPFHSWMLRVHVEAPTPVVMIHSGILLKMGAYGLLRFGVGWMPTYMDKAAFVIGILGVINIFYGGLLAFVEKEMKKMLAYSSISHMGIILLGVAALNEVGLQGALFQAISHGLISALLFYLVGILYERTRTTYLDDFSGLAKSMPLFSGILMVAALALLGLPGLSGFVSEFLAFLGLFGVHPVLAGIGAIGLILAAAYTLRALLKISFGPIKERFNALVDLRPKETLSLMVLVALIVLIGVYPAVLHSNEHFVPHSGVINMGEGR